MKITYQWGKWHITCRSRWYLPVTAVKIAEEDNIYWRGRVLHWRGSIRKCPYFRPLSVPKSVNPSISIFNNNNKNNWFFLIFCPPPPTFPLKKLFDAIKPNMLLRGNIVKNHKNLYNLIHNIYLSLTKVYGQYNYVIHLTFSSPKYGSQRSLGTRYTTWSIYHDVTSSSPSMVKSNLVS